MKRNLPGNIWSHYYPPFSSTPHFSHFSFLPSVLHFSDNNFRQKHIFITHRPVQIKKKRASSLRKAKMNEKMKQRRPFIISPVLISPLLYGKIKGASINLFWPALQQLPLTTTPITSSHNWYKKRLDLENNRKWHTYFAINFILLIFPSAPSWPLSFTPTEFH